MNALQALCEQYNVETDKIAIVEATEEYYLFLVKQEDCYDVVKVETVDTNIDYYTKAYKISSFNHTAYQSKNSLWEFLGCFTSRDSVSKGTFRTA